MLDFGSSAFRLTPHALRFTLHSLRFTANLLISSLALRRMAVKPISRWLLRSKVFIHFIAAYQLSTVFRFRLLALFMPRVPIAERFMTPAATAALLGAGRFDQEGRDQGRGVGRIHAFA